MIHTTEVDIGFHLNEECYKKDNPVLNLILGRNYHNNLDYIISSVDVFLMKNILMKYKEIFLSKETTYILFNKESYTTMKWLPMQNAITICAHDFYKCNAISRLEYPMHDFALHMNVLV